MRIDCTPGIVLPALFLLAGTFLLRESTAHSQRYMDSYLIARATMSAIGRMTASWAIQPHLAVRRKEQHARGHQQVEPR